MIRRLLSLLVLAAAAWRVGAEEMLVIVHPDSPIRQLSREQVSDLYLGRIRGLATIGVVKPLDQPRDSPMREHFFQTLNGMPLRQVNAYWARLQFSGEVQPPKQLRDSLAVIDAVAHTPNAIGYIDAGSLNAAVRPVLHLQ